MSEPYGFAFSIPGLPSLQSGAFGHWRARRDHDKRWKDNVWYALIGHKPPQPLQHAYVYYVRYSCARGAPDADNLHASFKCIQDALVGPVLVDDKPDNVTAHYDWQPCARGKGHVTVEVRESPRSDPQP